MQAESYLHPALFVTQSPGKGRGVFCSEDLPENLLIEVAPVIVMPAKDRALLDQTLLHDYIFEWGENKDQCIMALGWVPIYNHAYVSNCDYEMHFGEQLIVIKTVRPIYKVKNFLLTTTGHGTTILLYGSMLHNLVKQAFDLIQFQQSFHWR